LRLPEITTLMGSAFALAAFLHQNPSRRLLHVFLGVSLVPLYAAVHYRSVANPMSMPNAEVITAIAFACQASILMYGIFLLYWEKVYLDELTGIPNRRALNEHLARLGKTFSIAMVDIDHFKRFNDSYGHEEGDHVLRFVALHLDQATGGRAFRYGGEEFTVLFEKEDADEAGDTMEDARRTLAERTFTIRAPRGKASTAEEKRRRNQGATTQSQVRLTFSAGIADNRAVLRSPDEAIAAADDALYQAKESGRNCVVLAGAEPRKRRRPKQK
jgi:diguanylate cyclase (GGDEF)-like protein